MLVSQRIDDLHKGAHISCKCIPATACVQFSAQGHALTLVENPCTNVLHAEERFRSSEKGSVSLDLIDGELGLMRPLLTPLVVSWG